MYIYNNDKCLPLCLDNSMKQCTMFVAVFLVVLLGLAMTAEADGYPTGYGYNYPSAYARRGYGYPGYAGYGYGGNGYYGNGYRGNYLYGY